MGKNKALFKRGIVMIAGGHPYYGKMARNLAMGIKAYSDIDIALFVDDIGASHFTEFDKSLFTIHTLQEFTYRVTGRPDSFYRAKTFLPEITPFEETVFLDVDMIWCPGKKADDLFNVSGDFTMINEGYINFTTLENTISKNYHFWSRPENVRAAYKSDIKENSKLYQFRSEYIYFKNTGEVKKYFNLARKIYDNPKMESIRFGDILPDEIAFDIASAILQFYPEKNNYSPIYWDYLYSFFRYERKDIYEKYFAYSMGGKMVRDVQKSLYNDLTRYYHNHHGTTVDFLWEEKMHYAKHHQTVLK